nr:hypothetical protein BaRGS_020849 [Batillaria attramentaria]
MAYVASRDGDDPNTYTTAYHGGIWQVDEVVFEASQNCSSSLIATKCQSIQSEFGIDWSNVTWSDLRKPLYSGLAATLRSLLQLGGADMPGDVTQQAQFWVSSFGGVESDFVAEAGNATTTECADKMDLIFVLDSSGSVNSNQFNLMRAFAADVVDVMNITSEAVRVADVVFGSNVIVVCDLDDHSDKTSLRNTLSTTPRLGGGTMTYDALDQAAVTLYDAAGGARDDAKKVAILITDGKSWDSTKTADAAQTLKDKGTTVFAIGVGNYNETELYAVASDSACSHVFTLTAFTSIQTILTQIQSSTCDASLVLTPGTEVAGDITAQPVEVVTKTLNPGNNRTIVANVTCGTLDLYVSYTDSKPGPALYEERYNASHNSPVVLATRPTLAQGAPVYVTVVGSRVSQAEATLLNCTDYNWAVSVQDPAVYARLVSGSRASEGRVEVYSGGVWGSVCDDNFDVYDAMVICRTLGYTNVTPEVKTGGHYGQGTGTIWLDNVNCSGGESTVFTCPHNGLATHDCSHSEDVGIDCQPVNAKGRVEVSVGGVWGTVCHDNFDVTDAMVICSMLGYSGVTPEVKTGGHYGQGTGTIWLENVNCSGGESTVFTCPHNGLAVYDCGHSQDVGIDCQPVVATTGNVQGQFRTPNHLEAQPSNSDPPIPGLTEIPNVGRCVCAR